jgi:polyhydroxybutyrate depolymerase
LRSEIGRRWAAFALVTMLASACGSAATDPASTKPVAAPLEIDGPGRHEGEIVVDGSRRRFVVWIPEASPGPAPLVLVFHGFAGDPEGVEALSTFHELGDREGLVVAYPEGSGRPARWKVDARLQGDGDVVFVRELIALLGTVTPIDSHRVYAAGMSNGGGMAGRLACDAADVIAAVGSVAGAHNESACDPGRPIPVVEVHGSADRIVPFEGWPGWLPAADEWTERWADRNECAEPETEAVASDVERTTWSACRDGAEVRLYRIEDGRHGWPGSDRAALVGDSTLSIDATALLWGFFEVHVLP